MPSDVSQTTIIRRQFFWSARTLRCDVFVADDILGEHLDHTEDVLGIDGNWCVYSYPPYEDLIPELLNKHFGGKANG